MFRFDKFFSYVYKSFKIDADTLALRKIKDEKWAREVLFFKRTWFYGLFRSWSIPLSLIIMIANMYLLYFNFSSYIIATIIGAILFFNVVYWIWTFVYYLKHYKKIYSHWNVIEDVIRVIQRLEEWDKFFVSFFNRSWFNIIFLFILSIIVLVYVIINLAILSIWYAILNIFLFWVQIYFFKRLLNDTQNLEMDFYYAFNIYRKKWILDKWEFVIVNQNWTDKKWDVYFSTQIKSVTAKYSKFLWKFLDYGQVMIDTEWWDWTTWQIVIFYIRYPEKTADILRDILKHVKRKDSVVDNFILNDFLYKEWIKIDNFYKNIKDKKDLIKSLLTKYDKELKEIYTQTDDIDVKNEVQELYSWKIFGIDIK